VQELLQEGHIDMGHARALLALSKARQVELAEQVRARGLSVRETERLVRAAMAPPAVRRDAPTLDADGRRLQEDLSESLGATVQIRPRGTGKGSVVIEYSSLDELAGLVERLKRR